MREKAQKLRRLRCACFSGLLALGLAVSVCPAQRSSFSAITGGMDNLNVNCIAQDRAGYLWIGTENGLYRYDGNQFRKFGAGDGLRARIIQAIFVSPDDTLFIGTTDGLYFQRWDGRFTEIHPPASTRPFSQRIGTVFAALGPGRVVAADRSGAYLLQRQGPEQWTAEEMHLAHGPIWSLLVSPDGALWYGCGSDLCRMINGHSTALGATLHLPKDNWLHSLETSNGHIWLRGALHVSEVVPQAMRSISRDLPGQSIATPYQALAVDAKGRIAASQGPNLGLWENGHWRMLTERNGLSNSDISALFDDREGSLWFGIVGHGLMRWVGQDRWEAFTTADGLSDNIVWASLRDSQGRLWIGTESGLDWIPAGGTKAQPWHSSIPTVRAVSLAASPDGSLWMGSAAGRLVRIDERTLGGQAWKVPEVYRVLYDHRRHCVWTATTGGLYVTGTAPGSHPQLVESGAFQRAKVRFSDLSLDHAGQLWAASDDALYRLDNAGWHRIDPGLAAVVPHLIAAGSGGSLWAGGDFPGILRLRIEGDRVVEAQHIGRQHLLSEQVVALLVDHRGWLWVGHDAGITVFDGSAWRSFTQSAGLIWNDTDTDALAEDTDGSLWIGTSGGLSHLMQPAAAPAPMLQKPVFSQLDFGATPLTDGASLPWKASPLMVSIAALSFGDASRIHIRYRLRGLESDWVETPQENVRYPRLDPGRYRFEAQTVDVIDGRVSPVVALAFQITPRWWQSWELHVGLGLALLAAIVLLLRWRIHRLLRQKHQLELAVQLRTEDLEKEKAHLLRAREQMRHYAEHDDLTGLWNHRIVVERLRAEVDRARRDHTPLSVILADLDHFKAVNDTYGHPAGDRVLNQAGQIFLRSIRSYDWVGRYGGEEFLLILPGTNFTSARARAEQLRQAIEAARVQEGEATIRITASFGVASGVPADSEALIRAADTALYEAKGRGRNTVAGTEF